MRRKWNDPRNRPKVKATKPSVALALDELDNATVALTSVGRKLQRDGHLLSELTTDILMIQAGILAIRAENYLKEVVRDLMEAGGGGAVPKSVVLPDFAGDPATAAEQSDDDHDDL